MRRTGFLNGNRMQWMMGLCKVPFLCHLVFIKKFHHCPC